MTKRPNEEELGDQYQAAMEEWYASEDAALWESTIGDGLEDEPEWALESWRAAAAADETGRDESGGAMAPPITGS